VTEHRVRVADYAVGRGDDLLVSVGIGSCVAIALYDPATRIGALAHILLPSEGLSRDAGNRAKFPSTAVPLLLEEMKKAGATGTPRAKIAGGASMFAALIPAGGINMGERNVLATRTALQHAGIPVAGADVGGDYGRSVYFHLDDGRLLIRSLKKGDRVL
jgi:chemotaxis protein CheD